MCCTRSWMLSPSNNAERHLAHAPESWSTVLRDSVKRSRLTCLRSHKERRCRVSSPPLQVFNQRFVDARMFATSNRVCDDAHARAAGFFSHTADLSENVLHLQGTKKAQAVFIDAMAPSQVRRGPMLRLCDIVAEQVSQLTRSMPRLLLLLLPGHCSASVVKRCLSPVSSSSSRTSSMPCV